MQVALKDCAWERADDGLVVMIDPRETIELADGDGSVEQLLTQLKDGPLTPDDLLQALVGRGVEVDARQLAAALEALDGLGLLEDATGLDSDDPATGDRHFSNLAFFGWFSGLHRPRADFVRRMREAHVLQLGVGGGGSAIVQCLAGLGVGRITMVDCDEVELRNFSRQFLYRHVDVGRSKVERAAEWVREFDPTIEVRPVERRISTPDDLSDLLEGVAVVVGGVDEPPGVQLLVNGAAVRAGIPLVAGGMGGTRLVYTSVDPGRSACLACAAELVPGPDAPGLDGLAARLNQQLSRTNRMTGTLAAMGGALVAHEAARYITGFQPPYAVGAHVFLDLRDGLVPQRVPYAKSPDCEVCRSAGSRA